MTEIIEDEECDEMDKTAVSETGAPVIPPKKNDKIHLAISKKWTIALVIIAVFAVAMGACWKLGYFNQLSRWYYSASLTVRIVEKGTNQPVIGATVTVGTASVQTNSTGTAELKNISNGKQTVTITKELYTPKTIEVTFYRGSNPLDDIILEKAPEKVYTVSGTVTDIINSLNISKVKVVVSDASTVTDDKGVYLITVRAEASQIKFTADGYQPAQASLVLKDDKFAPVNIQLMPTKQVIYEQETGGKVSLYTTDFAGLKNVKVTVAGATYSDKTPISSPDESNVLFLTDRDGVKNNAGQVGYQIYLRNSTGSSTRLTSDLNPRNISWLDAKRIVYSYQKIQGSPSNDVIVVYNIETKKRTEVGNAPIGANVVSAISQLIPNKAGSYLAYYQSASAPDSTDAAAVAKAAESLGSFVLKTDGTGLKKMGDITNAPNKIYFSPADSHARLNYYVNGVAETHDYDISAATISTLGVKSLWERDYALKGYDEFVDATPAHVTIQLTGGRNIYIDTKNGKTDVFTTDSAGKNEIMLTNIGTAKTIAVSSDEKYVLVGAKDTSNTVSLYVVGTSGGIAKKLTDSFGLLAGFVTN